MSDKPITHDIKISIHAPRRGSDWRSSVCLTPSFTFQSTLPAGGATKEITAEILAIGISINAPRRGSDVAESSLMLYAAVISIHAPRRGSDGLARREGRGWQIISIHAPRRGSDM